MALGHGLPIRGHDRLGVLEVDMAGTPEQSEVAKAVVERLALLNQALDEAADLGIQVRLGVREISLTSITRPRMILGQRVELEEPLMITLSP